MDSPTAMLLEEQVGCTFHRVCMKDASTWMLPLEMERCWKKKQSKCFSNVCTIRGFVLFQGSTPAYRKWKTADTLQLDPAGKKKFTPYAVIQSEEAWTLPVSSQVKMNIYVFARFLLCFLALKDWKSRPKIFLPVFTPAFVISVTFTFSSWNPPVPLFPCKLIAVRCVQFISNNINPKPTGQSDAKHF